MKQFGTGTHHCWVSYIIWYTAKTDLVNTAYNNQIYTPSLQFGQDNGMIQMSNTITIIITIT